MSRKDNIYPKKEGKRPAIYGESIQLLRKRFSHFSIIVNYQRIAFIYIESYLLSRYLSLQQPSSREMAGPTLIGGGGGGYRCGCCGFLVQLLRGRWFMMFASFLIMAGAGATYLFGVYSKQIKATLGYDQSTLNLLGSCKDLGANVGVLSGLLAEVMFAFYIS